MKSRTWMWMLVMCLFPTLAVPIRLAAQNGKNHPTTITTFDPPGSTYTYPTSINPAGVITGFYYEGYGGHGYLRAPDGTFTSLDVPGLGNQPGGRDYGILL